MHGKKWVHVFKWAILLLSSKTPYICCMWTSCWGWNILQELGQYHAWRCLDSLHHNITSSAGLALHIILAFCVVICKRTFSNIQGNQNAQMTKLEDKYDDIFHRLYYFFVIVWNCKLTFIHPMRQLAPCVCKHKDSDVIFFNVRPISMICCLNICMCIWRTIQIKNY